MFAALSQISPFASAPVQFADTPDDHGALSGFLRATDGGWMTTSSSQCDVLDVEDQRRGQKDLVHTEQNGLLLLQCRERRLQLGLAVYDDGLSMRLSQQKLTRLSYADQRGIRSVCGQSARTKEGRYHESRQSEI